MLEKKKKIKQKRIKKACETVLHEIRKDYKLVLEVHTDGVVVEARGAAAGVYIADSERGETVFHKKKLSVCNFLSFFLFHSVNTTFVGYDSGVFLCLQS